MLSVNQELQGGRYRILSHFGQEDAGVSYQAFDNVLQTKVIIKETVFDAKANIYKNSMVRQMNNLTSIKHESFTQIHGYFAETDRQYLVTEATENETLKDLLDKHQKPFQLFDILAWTEQSLNALSYLHSKVPPIIHCGITPSSLILTKNKQIKLLTSAIIKNLNAEQSAKQQLSDVKFPYLSLELLWETLDSASQKVILNSYDVESAELLESPVDERSSVYALGATMYQLVTGKVPINALERSIDLLEGKNDPLLNPSNLNSQIPRNFSAFLLKALEIRRENRFSSVSAMRISLQPMLDLMKRIQNERQKEAPPIVAKVDDQAVREAAMRQVELARQTLKKQREEEELKRVQAAQEALQIQAAQAVIESKSEVEQPAQIIEEVQPPVLAASVAQVQAEIVAKSEPIEIVEQPLISPIVTSSPIIAEEPIQTAFAVENEPELFASATIERKKPFWLIPAFCAVLVLVVGGWFGMKFLNANSSETVDQKVTEQPAKTEETPPATTQLTAPITTQEQPAATQTNLVENAPIVPNQPKTIIKKSVAPTPAIEKKLPTPAKTPAPKKKEVSVDDIINDN